MQPRNINPFDLNLIKAFLAIWELGSLTAAGDRLALTQPAVSHALRRLREQFGDPLFVRVGNRMVPTEAALRLYEPFERALHIVSETVQGYGEFSPGTSTRTFRLAMSDLSEFYFLPRILAHVEAVAPSVRLESIGLEAEMVESAMRAGQVDMALGYLPRLSDNCLSQTVFLDRYIVLVRRDHPFPGDRLTEEDFSRLVYVDISTNAPGYHLFEQQLAMIGARRRVAVRLGHISVAPEIVRQTDMAAIYPNSISCRLNAGGEFRLLPLPFDVPPVVIGIHVHKLFAQDPGIIWLRNVIMDHLDP